MVLSWKGHAELESKRFSPSCSKSSVFCVWRVRDVCQSCLPLAHVPVQTLGQAFEPVVHQVMATDGRHRVTGCSDLDTVRNERELVGIQDGRRLRRESAADDTYQSPCWISCLFLPSNDTQAVFLASGERVICLKKTNCQFPSYKKIELNANTSTPRWYRQAEVDPNVTFTNWMHFNSEMMVALAQGLAVTWPV